MPRYFIALSSGSFHSPAMVPSLVPESISLLTPAYNGCVEACPQPPMALVRLLSPLARSSKPLVLHLHPGQRRLSRVVSRKFPIGLRSTPRFSTRQEAAMHSMQDVSLCELLPLVAEELLAEEPTESCFPCW